MTANISESIKQRIIEVANTLVLEGIESPTNNEVRERLGGGSLSHISPVMREWRNERKEQVTMSVEIPADLKKVIETALAQVWNTSNNIAFSTIETIKTESESQIDEANQERDEALIEVEKLERENLSLQDQLRNALINLDKQTERANGLQAEAMSLERVLEERKERITKLEADYEKLQQELIEIVKNTNTPKE